MTSQVRSSVAADGLRSQLPAAAHDEIVSDRAASVGDNFVTCISRWLRLQGVGRYARTTLVGRSCIYIGGFTVSVRETPTGVTQCWSYRSVAVARCAVQR